MSRSISPGTEEAGQKRRSTSNMESIRIRPGAEDRVGLEMELRNRTIPASWVIYFNDAGELMV